MNGRLTPEEIDSLKIVSNDDEPPGQDIGPLVDALNQLLIALSQVRHEAALARRYSMGVFWLVGMLAVTMVGVHW